MKLTLQLQLLPDADQKPILLDTMKRFNAAASFAAKVGFEAKVFSQPSLHGRCYREIRARFGLSAQMAVRAIGKAVAVFARDKTTCPVFKPHGAVTYDQRILSFKGLDKVSLWAVGGRMILPLIHGAYQGERLDRMKGQVDLVYREGKFFLYATIELPDAAPVEPTDFLGVDMGLANIATDSDGATHSGKAVDDIRRKHNRQRKRLQRRGTKGAKKPLRRLARKEARFRRHQNHPISKTIVETAKRTSRGMAVEDLKGIRERVTARGPDARNRLSGWGFHQLHGFLASKAQRAGVPGVQVDPRSTSPTCAEGGHRERSHRKSQAEFQSASWGHEAHADSNAARNIRALAAWNAATELVDRKIEPESHTA